MSEFKAIKETMSPGLGSYKVVKGEESVMHPKMVYAQKSVTNMSTEKQAKWYAEAIAWGLNNFPPFPERNEREMTIFIEDIELVAVFSVSEEEPMAMYYPDGSGHPGCPAEITSLGIYYKGMDVTEIYECRRSEIEEMIWDKLREDGV